MQQLITLIILAIGQLYVYVDHNAVDKNFALIEDFEKSQMLFSSDTFDLIDQSTEGGELITFHNKDKDYLVFDILLFGERGKIHTTYWTDKNVNFKIAKRTNFKYDKPYYEKGYKVTETTEYLSYSGNSLRRYSADKRELKDSADEMKIESEKLFYETTKNLKIVK